MKAKFIALAALVLGMVSCQQDFDGAAQVGGEVDFQLAVAAPELAGTRADGDGQNGHNSAYGAIDYLSEADWANVDLRYTLEVYDAENVTADPVKDRMVMIVDKYTPVTFDLRLVPNRPYRFVVFADFVGNGNAMEKAAVADIDAQKELGLHHVIGKTLQDITLANDAINEEFTDAYFDFEVITVSNSAAQDMTLTRPFGKVRVIATDLAELNLNVDPTAVTVTYESEIPTAFNAVNGEVSTMVKKLSFSYDYAAISKTDLSAHYYTEGYDAMKNDKGEKGRHTHMTLFTDYILAKEEMTPLQFTMTVWEDKEAEKAIKTTEFNTDIPVQRNHLTTIIGNVLTTATEIHVDINDDFCDECDIVKNYIGVASARELQAALDNAKAGEINVINFEADINAIEEEVNPVIIIEKPNTTIILNGNGYKFDGCMRIKGMSEYKNAHTVFQNINFETADASKFIGTESAFIYCRETKGSSDTSPRYPDNVTIKDCSFTATGAAEQKAVGAKFWSLRDNFVVENTTANGMHSLVQLTSCGDANVTINEVKIENCKNGIGLGATATAVIKNSNIATTVYGVRADGCNANTTFEDVTIAATQPVIVRKVTAGEYVVNFVGENTLTTTADYQVIFTAGADDAAYVEPASGLWSVNGAEKFRVFPETKIDENYEETIDIYNVADLLHWAWMVNNTTGKFHANILANIELPAFEITEDAANKTYVHNTDKAIEVVDGRPSGNNWPVISDYESISAGNKVYYAGKVIGNGNTISGLRINHDLVASGFLCWTKGAAVENLTFNDAVVYNKGGNYGESYTGIVIGRCWDGSYVDNCHITYSSVEGYTEVGGLVGRVYHRTQKADGTWLGEKMAYVVYCSTDENTIVKGVSSIGGIAGMNYGCVVGNCENNADVIGNGSVGGIVGFHRSYNTKTDAFILGCRTTDKATITATNGSAGGFVGHIVKDDNHKNAKSWIVGCACESQVVGNKVGSMIGSIQGGKPGVSACYALTSINAAIAGSGTPDLNAVYNVNDYSEITEERIQAMNAAIEEFNNSPDNVYVNDEQGAEMKRRWALDNGVPVLQ